MIAVSPDPPNPGVPPWILELLARLVWAATPGAFDAAGLSLGLFAPATGGASTGLYIDKDEKWGAYTATCAGLGPFSVTEGTAQVFQRGTLATDGSFRYDGRRYRVQALIELGHPIARAVEVF
jgi:hypothetical protein